MAVAKFRIVNTDGIGRKTYVYDAETGKRIRGITRVSIPEFGNGEIVKANITAYAEFDLLCEGEVALTPIPGRFIHEFQLP